MRRSQPERSEIVEAAFVALRETSIPDGPSPEVLSAIFEAGDLSEGDLQPITLHERRFTMRPTAKLAIVAAVLVGVCVGISYVVTERNGSVLASTVLAEAYEQIQQAKTVTWTNVFYHDVSTKDKRTIWIETIITRCMYKAPGCTREVRLDKQGQVRKITIEDRVRGMRLELLPKEKRATLTHLGKPSRRDLHCLTDAFTPVERWLCDLTDTSPSARRQINTHAEFLGKKQIDGREANGFRLIVAGKPDWSSDLWVDAETKHLVLTHSPGTDVYDPENHPERHNPPGKEWFRTAMAWVKRDIVFDRKLDDSLFSLDPPEGYAVTTVRVPEPTEKDMIEWLGIQAECNGNVFLDDERPIEGEVLRRIGKKADQGEELSPAERKVLERSHHLDTQHHTVRRFAEVTANKTWHYQGKGVKLGDENAIVCWYRPKGRNTYRVVYGDLSVKDVEPENLPRTDAPE